MANLFFNKPKEYRRLDSCQANMDDTDSIEIFPVELGWA